jgi:methyltransferase (TIGR00027 family)
MPTDDAATRLGAGRPSRTAQRVALRRAAHQLLDDPPVFVDPLALRMVGPSAEAKLRANPRAHDRGFGSKPLRAFLVARSRVAEDELAAGVAARGVRQYVLLGAGLDTFAYRNPFAARGLRVFEVDHPATQAWKRARLAEVGIPTPPSLVFVAVDFARQDLGERLTASGHDAAVPTVFGWLGVTPYLEEEAVVGTLRRIAAAAPASSVVFDYSVAPRALGFLERFAYRRLARRVASVGEPFRSGFEPARLAVLLRELGFVEVEDLGATELNRRFFAGRKDRLRVGALGRVMTARLAR